jgi:hypothetical protein
MTQMAFVNEEDDVVNKRRMMFIVLRREGLKLTKNTDITEEDVDRMWID